MIKNSPICWTCKSPIISSQVHKIYMPESSRRIEQTTQDSQELTKEEILKTMLTDLEIECQRNANRYAELKDTVDVYAMSYAHFVNLNNELKMKNEILEEKLVIIQEKLDRCSRIVEEYDNRSISYNTRSKKSTRSNAKL